MNKLFYQVEAIKEMCFENKLQLTKIIIPRSLNDELTKAYPPTITDKHLPREVKTFVGIPVYIRDDIDKAQFVIEAR